MSNLNDDEMKKVIEAAEKGKKTQPASQPQESNEKSPVVRKLKADSRERSLLIIGTGDAGANVASLVKDETSQHTIIYNTSKRGLENLKCDKAIIPNSEDGSGKERSFSKDIFKRGPHETMLAAAREANDKNHFDYVVVNTSTNGGTGGGASPNVAKFLADNLHIPAIVLGIYPDFKEDAKSLFNALAWQTEIEKIKTPYMIFDNNKYSSLSEPEKHSRINIEIAAVMKVFAGKVYGDTNIMAIDNKDIEKMVHHGKRMTIYTTTRRPKMEETLDTFLINMISESAQPEPINPEAYAILVKGPLDFLKTLDLSLSGIREKYGNEIEKFRHVEESDEVQITLIASGCEIPFPRLKAMKTKYDELMSSRKSTEASVTSLLEGMSDPFSAPKAKKVTGDEKTDNSALDI